MLLATLVSIALVCGVIILLGVCEKAFEKMGIFPEDYEEDYC